MKTIARLRFIVVAAAICACSLVSAQIPSGPNTMKPADLPNDLKPMQIIQTGYSIRDMMNAPFMMLAQTGGSSEADTQMQIMKAASIFWTNGEMVNVWNSHTFLVAWQLDLNSLAAPHSGPLPDMTKAVMVRVLVNTDQILNITPRDEMSKQDFLEVLGIGSPGQTQQVAADSARQQSLQNAKQIVLGTIMYAGDNDDYLPYAKSSRGAMKAVLPYIKNMDALKTKNPNGGWFQYNMCLSGASATAAAEPTMTPLYYDSKEWPDGGRVVGFLDGHSAYLTKDRWEALARYLKLNFPRKGKPLPADYGSDLDIGNLR